MTSTPFVRRTLTTLVVAPLAVALVACGDSDDDDDAAAPAPTVTVTATPDAGDDGGNAGGNGGNGGNGGGATGDQGRAGQSGALLAAARTALGEVSGATVTSVDDDPSGWEVTLLTGSGEDQEVVVNGDGSQVVSGPTPDADLDTDDLAEEQAQVQAAKIDYAAAVEAASGAASGQVTSVDLDGDNGITTWTVTVLDGTAEQEVTVDAASGDVLGTEQDD